MEIIADMSKEEEVNRMMDEIIEHFNQLDVIVNNAGLGGNESNASLEEFDAFMTINLRSCYQICLRARPLLEKSKGAIVNVSSICAIKPVCHSIVILNNKIFFSSNI